MKMQRSVEFMAKNSHMLGPEVSKIMGTMPSQSLRMAVAVMIIIPIACAYPFFQRYVVQGLTVGSVKG
jgi:putative aldouronate transport system permease protein